MSEGTWKLQTNYKHGQTDQHLLNVRGDTPGELKALLETSISEDVLGTVVAVGDLLGAIHAVNQAALLPPPTPLDTLRAEAHAPAPPPAAAPDPGGQVVPLTPFPSCSHGPKKVISKMGAKGQWYAYACQASQDDPTKHKLDFEVEPEHKAKGLVKFL